MKGKIKVCNNESIKHNPYTKRHAIALTQPHMHTFWEIVIILQGEITNEVNKSKINMNVFDVMVIRPSDVHFYKYNEKSKNIDYRDFYISDEKMKVVCETVEKGLYARLKESFLPLIFNLDSLHIASIEKSATVFESYHQIEESKQKLFNNLIARIVSLCIENESGANGRLNYPEFFSRILRHIEKNIQTITTEQIIDMMGYSRGHCDRLFVKYTGKALFNYISDSKLNHATELLMNRGYTVLQIATELGYSNQSGFIKAFKKRFKVSPTEWRKQ